MAIFDSSNYKKYLEKETKKLRKTLRTNIATIGKYDFELEKYLFVTAYLIRKLIEAKKISRKLEESLIVVRCSRARNFKAILDPLRKREIFQNYDWSNSDKKQISLIDLMHIFVHSYTLGYALNGHVNTYDPSACLEILITSDKRKQDIYYIMLEDYMNICLGVASDKIRGTKADSGRTHKSNKRLTSSS